MKKVQGNDSFQRINYLYQISKHLVDKYPALASYYGNQVVNVAKKNVLRIHPDIKRQLCKKCKCALIHGVSAKMKIKRRGKSNIVQWLCTICNTKKTLPADRNTDHKIWLEKPEAIVEVIQ